MSGAASLLPPPPAGEGRGWGGCIRFTFAPTLTLPRRRGREPMLTNIALR